MASTCFEHYVLILKRRFTNGTWYTACVLCQLTAAGMGVTGVSDISSTPILVQPTDITRTQYNKCRLWSASWGWASNARNMQRPLVLNKLNRKCITLVSLYWCTMMHGQQNISNYIDVLLLSKQPLSLSLNVTQTLYLKIFQGPVFWCFTYPVAVYFIKLQIEQTFANDRIHSQGFPYLKCRCR
jgi:hypothetical protein